jgi:hypothetical protein
MGTLFGFLWLVENWKLEQKLEELVLIAQVLAALS